MKKLFSFLAAAFVAVTMNAQAISVAEAISAGMALDSAATSEAVYTIEGYVVNSQPFSLSYNNQIWFMADDAANSGNQEFQAYGCVAIEGADTLQVIDGDKVQLTGNLFKYYNRGASKYVIEVKNGTAAFITKAEGDHSINKETTSITVARALEIAADVAIGATTPETYEITGYVTVMLGKETDYEQFGNQTFWIADENNGADSNDAGAFEVFRGKAPQAVKVGDLIKVKTAIKRYADGSEKGLVESETNAPITILDGGDVPPVVEADVVFDKDDFAGQGTSSTGSEVTATKNGVTFTCNKAYGDGQYGIRCYKNSNVSVVSESEQIGKIVFEFATVSGTYYNGGLPDEIVVNGMEWSAEGLSSQARMNKIMIYFGEAEGPVFTIDTIKVSEAVEIGMALEAGGVTEKEYVVFGVACTTYEPNEGYSDQTWYMHDSDPSAFSEFQAYHCTPDFLVQQGDFLYVKGKITKYVKNEKVTIEISNGTATHLYGEGIENVVLTEKAQKVVVDGVIYIVRDGKMFNVQGAQVR